MENTSMLPQPTRHTGIPRVLAEVSDSDSNSRNVIPAPSMTGLKRPGSNLPEPAAKRKTLAERAGEPIKPASSSTVPPTATTGVFNTFSGSTSGSALNAYRNASTVSSQSLRSNSASSRSISNTSMASSVGSGIRAPMTRPPANPGRPKTSLARDRGFTGPRTVKTLFSHGEPHEVDQTKQTFDPEEPYKNFKRLFEDYKDMYQDSLAKVAEAREEGSIFKETMSKLEQERSSATETIISLRSENETLRYRIETAEKAVTNQKAEHEARAEEVRRLQSADREKVRQEHKNEIEELKSEHREETKEDKKRYEEELSTERARRIEALGQVSTQGVLERQRFQLDLEKKEQEVKDAQRDVQRVNEVLQREKQLNDDLRSNLSSAGENAASMETARQALQAKIAFLESDNKSQSESYAAMEKRMNEALEQAEEYKQKLRKEETLRKKLHNQVQELKGNIRVFCRVRPNLGGEDDLARMSYPDTDESTEIEVRGPDETNSLGKVTTKTYPFAFDRVFDPAADNALIFEEISQLIQSALDGYNVCIFAYGQTGSGKTYTMSSDDGMIPKALRQIYSTSKALESTGWSYSMEGSFVEVYNEEIRDLLGDDEKVGNKKHEVRHDMVKCETTITDATTLNLNSQEQVESILTQAMSRRSVAATKANERSSRSHSVFILKLVGHNSVTGEKSKGTLNLVDLAGSERLSHSKVEGQRLKETQSINKSLSCLGDVIGALGQQQQGRTTPGFDGKPGSSGSTSVAATAAGGTAHIPYRNSKLTYLLQFSLGGNSKTLMFVMVAPEKKCLGETITSLKFAEKVARTKLGVAKKVK